MYGKTKIILTYVSIVIFGVLLAVNLAQAKSVEPVLDDEFETIQSIELNQAELDQLLAPIALYPDTVLSQVLVASTYPLELVQAAKWRQNNSELDEKEALDAVEDMDWDPSVKALVPFDNLLQQLVEDLNWLQDLGDAFLSNETQVLASVQSLRHKAYQQGSLSNNKYIEVVEEEDDILITPVNREIIYVPYYDTRVVYGNWHWADYPPYYWHRPSHYYWHAGLYWSPRVFIRNSFFFGGFHWRNRQVVVHHSPRHYGRYDDGQRRVRVNEYQRWTHDSRHRRGVRYSHNTPKTVYTRQGQRDVKRIRNSATLQQNNGGQSKVKMTRNSESLQQRVKRETVSDNRYKGDRSQANPKVTSTHQRLRQETTQTQRSVTTDGQENRQRPEGRDRYDRSKGKAKVSSTHQRLRQETTQTHNQQRDKQQSVQRPVKQYQTDSRQTDSRQAAPKQKTYSQAKQRNYSQPMQRTYSQPQQRVSNTAQRPSKSAHRSGSKVRSHGAKQKQR